MLLVVCHSQTTDTLHCWTSTPAVLEAWREYTPRSSFVMPDRVRLALTPSPSPSSLVDILVSVEVMGSWLCLHWVEGRGSPTARADRARVSPGSRPKSTAATSLMTAASVGECQLAVYTIGREHSEFLAEYTRHCTTDALQMKGTAKRICLRRTLRSCGLGVYGMRLSSVWAGLL